MRSPWNLRPRSGLSSVIVAAGVVLASSARAETYVGNDAVMIIQALETTRQFCFVNQVRTPSGVVEQEYCRCVSRVNGSGLGPNRVPYIEVSFGPEQPCRSTTAQQQQQAQQRLAFVNNAIAQWDNYLRWVSNVNNVCDPWEMLKNDSYRRLCEQYVANEVERAKYYRAQFSAERAALTGAATTPVAGPVAPPPALPSPRPASGAPATLRPQAVPPLPSVPPTTTLAPAGTAQPDSGSGILGVEIPEMATP